MDRAQRVTLIAAGLGLLMIFLDALIVNVALPDIQREFNVGEAGCSGSSPLVPARQRGDDERRGAGSFEARAVRALTALRRRVSAGPACSRRPG